MVPNEEQNNFKQNNFLKIPKQFWAYTLIFTLFHTNFDEIKKVRLLSNCY